VQNKKVVPKGRLVLLLSGKINYLVSGAALVAGAVALLSVVAGAATESVVVGATVSGAVSGAATESTVFSLVASLEPQEVTKRPIAKATTLNLINFIFCVFLFF
jgi:hypothetical protein